MFPLPFPGDFGVKQEPRSTGRGEGALGRAGGDPSELCSPLICCYSLMCGQPGVGTGQVLFQEHRNSLMIPMTCQREVFPSFALGQQDFILLFCP